MSRTFIITGNPTTMSNSRVEKATELFEKGYNCSQSVFCAYADLFGIDETTAFNISAGFGGGFGRMREVCGAFSAVTMLAGLKGDYTLPQNKAVIYEKIRALSEKFRESSGSIICRELLGVKKTPESHIPEERTPEYMKKRPCPNVVKAAAEIVEDFIYD